MRYVFGLIIFLSTLGVQSTAQPTLKQKSTLRIPDFCTLQPLVLGNKKGEPTGISEIIELLNQKCVGKCAPSIPFTAAPFSKFACTDPVDADQICFQASEDCLKISSSNCVNYTYLHLCPPGYVVRESYFINQNRHKFNYTAKKFYAVTHEELFQNRCCGKDLVCKNGLSQTKLNILLGLGVADSTAHYRLGSNQVEVSSGIISRCFTSDCIDGIIFHELGHVCHNWHYRTQSGVPISDRATVFSTLKDLTDHLGAEAVQCIKQSLHLDHMTEDQKILRLEEVLADAAFFDSWKTARFGWNCNGLKDNEHPLFKSYVGCFLKNSTMRDAFCLVSPSGSHAKPNINSDQKEKGVR